MFGGSRIRRALLVGSLLALASIPTASAAAIPSSPAKVVENWRLNQRALAAAISGWDKTGAPPRNLVVLARQQQQVIRALAADPPLARRVERQLPAIKNDVTARTDLNRLARHSPLPPSPPHVGAAAPADRLLGWYRHAGRQFSVRWQLLAAINFVESAFGRVKNRSGAGAQGPMQFLPATWRAYGLGGDIDDPHDAILGAANYLAANGAGHDERTALFHYNPSSLYVDAISRYANQIAGDRNAFYAYYAWRVFFRHR